jgi:uncharacterized repeat protein (TIGR03803 family)
MVRQLFTRVSKPSSLLLSALLFLTGAANAASTTVLHEFGLGQDGASPSSSIIFDSAGNIYGETASGGTGPCTGGCGTVYRISPDGTGFKETGSYSFRGPTHGDGRTPQGALIMDSAGNLYGVTSNGGTKDSGTVFKLTPGSNGAWTESVLYAFGVASGQAGGIGPSGKLLLDGSGNLYGVTAGGGSRNGGVVFELTPSASGPWTETVLHSFAPAGKLDGNQPVGIIFDSAGDIFGVTSFGGTESVEGAGTVFELVNESGLWAYRSVHTFAPTGENLQTPNGGMVFDSSGNLYVGMSRGGRGGAGVVELIPNGNKYAPAALYSFLGEGLPPAPYEALVFDNSGNLYSASYPGGPGSGCDIGCGLVYKLSPGEPHWIPTQVDLTTDGVLGGEPFGGVTLDSQGNIYVATAINGTHGGGALFRINP